VIDVYIYIYIYIYRERERERERERGREVVSSPRNDTLKVSQCLGSMEICAPGRYPPRASQEYSPARQ